MKVKVKVSQSYPILCDPMDYTVREILQARILEWVTFPSPGNLPNPGIKPRFPVLQADSLPAEPQGEPKNTGVGSLSLLQQIFLTQESKQSLLHCRQILYQLGYQGNPCSIIIITMLIACCLFPISRTEDPQEHFSNHDVSQTPEEALRTCC